MIPEKKNEGDNVSRRSFLRNGALAAAGFMIVPRHVLGRGYVAPSDRLRVAGIGVGGKGFSDISEFAKGPADITFLCDVDKRRAAEAVRNSLKRNSIPTSGKCLTRNTKTSTLFLYPHQIIRMP